MGTGRWRLSPVFDVNPAPDRNPHLETAILEGGAQARDYEPAFLNDQTTIALQDL